jgi:antibiotic biosynthesis monooxygenase (ABM) superfamily enzyme
VTQVPHRTEWTMRSAMRLRLVFLILNWMSAFVIVMALFLAFGDELRDLALAYRALVISGVLSVSMSQVVAPLLNRLVRAVVMRRR